MITVADLIDLWKADGYKLEKEWTGYRNDSTWTLYYTSFKYMTYEYRRHRCVLVESIRDDQENDIVKRTRILEFIAGDDIGSTIHEAQNLMELNWGDELHGIH